MASLSAVAGNAIDVRRNTFTSGGVRVPRSAGFARVARVPRVRAVVNAASGPEVREAILTHVTPFRRSRGLLTTRKPGMAVAWQCGIFFAPTTYSLRVEGSATGVCLSIICG